jgi:hypothetical protein
VPAAEILLQLPTEPKTGWFGSSRIRSELLLQSSSVNRPSIGDKADFE